MNTHALEVLEFEKVRRMLLRWTFSIHGRELVGRLMPDLEPGEIALSQARITEWKRLEMNGAAPGPAELSDMRPLLLRLERSEGVLDGGQIYQFLPFLDHLTALRRIWQEEQQHAGCSPNLASIASRIADFGALAHRLRLSIGSGGEVLDSASPALGRVRRELLDAQQRASELLERILVGLSGPAREEGFVTLREGRYVLSVRSGKRGELPGLLHGRSSSGQSLLIEPLEAVDTNNRVADASEEEKLEEARVLRELSGLLREHAESLTTAHGAVGILDCIRAQARVAIDLRAEPPAVNDTGVLRIVRGRHPILAEAEGRGGPPVVPLQLEMSSGRPVLLISGPNMGGKTVALKTVGLLVLMARAGLHVPAADGTDLPLVDDLFVDLGDEQSIEGDLSTFAGHLRNMGEMWDHATPRSLVILDELGGGTDPEDGSALGMAMLGGMSERGTMTLATTHLSPVKLFAAEHPAMQNAAMEFDAVSMTPLYRLRIGEPGWSRAFDIARRILHSDDLLSRAEKYRSPLQVRMDELLGAIDSEKRRLEDARTGLEEERASLRRATARRERMADHLRERLDRIRTERRAAAGRLYSEAEEFVRGLRDSLEAKVRQAEEAARDAAQERARARLAAPVREAERELAARRASLRADRAQTRPGRVLPKELILPGALAWHPGMGAAVRIERVSGSRIWVEAKGVRLEVPAGSLEELTSEQRRVVSVRQGSGIRLEEPAGEPVGRELDLRGCRAEEALERLGRFLDRASLQRMHQVRIVHGKGTGALKKEVERYLESHPLVASHRTGELGEGGWGVTVADLDEEHG